MKTNGMNKKAFTLTEMIVVVAVIAVSAAVVLPSVLDYTDVKADVTGRKIVAAIRFAKSRALAERQTYRVVFNLKANSVRVENEKGTAAWNPVTWSDYEWTLKHGQISKVGFGESPELEFGPLGEASSGGQIIVVYGTLTQTFTVSPITGRVAVVETGE